MEDSLSQFGNRLKLARKMAGMSLQDLSDSLTNKVSKQALSKYEQGEMNPTPQVLLAIARALQVKPDYFLKKKSLELGKVLFRKKASLSKRDEDMVVEKVRDYVERYLELEQIMDVQYEFQNPLKDFPIQIKENIVNAAETLRNAWSLGDDPIPNLVEMLELKGIKVILLNEADIIDGLAVFTASGIPVVVVNTLNKPIERIRFTIIHELAHLLLKLDAVADNEKKEEEWCHYFASSFLLPTHMLRKLIGGQRTYIHINELIKIKEYYGMSIRAILHRLHTIGIISPNYYKRWMVFMNNTYGAKEEPGSYKGEEASKGFDLLIARGISEGIISLSKAASLSNTDINKLRKEYVGIR